MGVPFPGTPNNEHGQPNWIGHLVRSFGHGQGNILVYDYAVRGDTIKGVRGQVKTQFIPIVGKKPQWAPWRASDSLFGKYCSYFGIAIGLNNELNDFAVTWIGVNDCRLV
jgi:hypothetical protein